MARGDLMKKLLASFGHEDEFRAVAEQIIAEEEKKNNLVLARSLRRSLDTAAHRPGPKPLAKLLPFPDAANDFVERIEPAYTKNDIVLSSENTRIFLSLMKEFRKGDEVRRRGLPVRSKLLFCGPPGCGKTLCAEVFSAELGLPLFVVRLDRLISSYLGETATNIRKVFEFARKQPCVLFLDEFDALARSRGDSSEHNELRRVVNSLLIFIDRIRPSGFLIAATNLEASLDAAIWRRFDEVVWFDKPDGAMTQKFLKLKFKNVPVDFDFTESSDVFRGYSYAEIERVCLQAIKTSILEGRKLVLEADFKQAVADEVRRKQSKTRLSQKN